MGHYAPPMASNPPDQDLTSGGLIPNLALFSGVLKAPPIKVYVWYINLVNMRGNITISQHNQHDPDAARSGQDDHDKTSSSPSLTALQQKIKNAEQAREIAKDSGRRRSHLPAEMMAMVGRIATEMVAGIAVGGFLGWMLDSWLGTSPLLMIVLFFFGAAAGMLNIWRMASGHGLKIGYFDHQDGNDNSDDHEQDRTRD